MHNFFILLSLIGFSLLCGACSDKNRESRDHDPRDDALAQPSQQTEVPTPNTPSLIRGKAVWEENCRRCHETGVADAPKISDPESWAPRIAKGIKVLRYHAIHGFQGPSGTEMPAKAGNPELSDAEVSEAVDYMVWVLQAKR